MIRADHVTPEEQQRKQGMRVYVDPNPLSAGDVINITMTYDTATADFRMELRDVGGTSYATSATGSGSENITYIVTGAETQPFVLKCDLANPSFGDYHLAGTR